MKTVVNIYENNITSSRNFENKIAELINNKLAEYGEKPVDIIEVNSVGMSWKGRGQYSEIMDLTIDEKSYDVTRHSTDSQTFDTIGDSDINPTTYNNFYKKFTLSLLSNKIDRLADDILENRNKDNEED